MPAIKWFQFIVIAVVMLSNNWYGGVFCKDDIYKVQQGIRSAAETAKTVGELAKNLAEGTAETAKKIGGIIGKFAPALGALGFIVPFILSFIPKSKEDKNMKFLKEKFSQMNEKLDEISAKFEKVEIKITFENQKSVYIEPEAKIESSHRSVQKFFDDIQAVDCSLKTRRECERQKDYIAGLYKEIFKDTDKAYHMIFQVGSSTFRDSFLYLVREQHKCNIPKLQNVCDKLMFLAYKAQKVMIIYNKISGSTMSVVESQASWISTVYKLRHEMNQNINYCIRSILAEHSGQNRIVKDLKENSGLAISFIRNLFEKKYDWLLWVSIFVK